VLLTVAAAAQCGRLAHGSFGSYALRSRRLEVQRLEDAKRSRIEEGRSRDRPADGRPLIHRAAVALDP
jgi:hypothetical protein